MIRRSGWGLSWLASLRMHLQKFRLAVAWFLLSSFKFGGRCFDGQIAGVGRRDGRRWWRVGRQVGTITTETVQRERDQSGDGACHLKFRLASCWD